MTLTAGTRLGPYEIVAPLGAGGMGEVYRAKDTRLGREVAVKVLPQHLSENVDIRTRFEREAKTISSLNHPNICTLFDVGREGETDYLVMELIEGDTLAERLRKGPLAAPELIRYGVQIADALDRAHRAGVVHRDLKPGNVMLTRSGAKLMDFGLSRATGMTGQTASGATMAALTQSPTMPHALTAEGTIVGTFQYMSPEQLEGREADARSDIWALGCVLFEMATGRRAFEGRSQASLIAAILEREPGAIGEAPSGSSQAGGPPQGLDRLIRTCLAKDPEERNQTAHDVKLQLQWIAENAGLSNAGVPASTPVPVAAPVKRGDSRLAWAVAAAMAIVGAGAIAWLWPRANAPQPAYRFHVEALPDGADFFWPRVSPDGRTLVFASADSNGVVSAWVRPMDQALSRRIIGSEGLRRPYWSPDGREIAFVAGGKIQRLSITGGAPVVVCESPGGADLSWGSRGQILMDGSASDSLQVVPARGGELRPATHIDRAAGESGSAWPCFLPDGEHFLFIGQVASGGSGGRIRLGRVGSLDSRVLGHSDGRVEYAPGGWVLYLKGTTLLAQKLDLGGAKLTGQPLTIAEGLRTGSSEGHFSVSPTGVLAMARLEDARPSSVFEADRTGRMTGPPITTGLIANPALSPEGGRLLFERKDVGKADPEIWIRDLMRGTETKLTFGGGAARQPTWSPDGRRFAYALGRGAQGGLIMVSSADGLGGRDSIVVPDGGVPMLTQWFALDSSLVIVPGNFQGARVVHPDRVDRALRAIPGSTGLLAQATISPDGRWLAYASNEGGGPAQVYVRSLTGTPGRWQISTKSGFSPRWTRGGQELVFESNEGIMAVDLDTHAVFQAGTPHPLFTVPLGATGPGAFYWDVSEDGQRFFLVVPPKARTVGDIEIVSDFHSLVNRK